MTTAPRARRAFRGPLREIAGSALALALSIAVAAHALGAQHQLLLTDPDSVVTVLQARSIVSGMPQDWALSPVLFVPEASVYGVLYVMASWFPVSVEVAVRWALALNAVVNLLALYGAIRVVARRRRSPSDHSGGAAAPVTGAILAFAAFCTLALLEGSPLPAQVLASLTTTTTYYSASVVASVAIIGVAVRAADRPRHPVALAIAAGAIGLVSTLSNPLFVAWAVLPLLVIVAVVAFARRGILPRATWVVVFTTIAGCVIGYGARVTLFSGVIVAVDQQYARPSLWASSLTRYAGFVEQMAGSAAGWLWIVVVASLSAAAAVVAVVRFVRVAEDAETGIPAAAIAAYAGFVPLVVTVGMIALGTQSERYLQPWAFAPVLVLVLAPEGLRALVHRADAREASNARAARSSSLRTRGALRGLAGIAIAVVTIVGIAAAPPLVARASASDPDLACVTAWVAAHPDRTGGGQFASVRAPKAYAADPSRLVQVDEWMRPYLWLVDRSDYSSLPGITYLVADRRSAQFQLPGGVTTAQASTVSCGRYWILDFGTRVLPFGEPHS